jgi:hypothetical protein
MAGGRGWKAKLKGVGDRSRFQGSRVDGIALTAPDLPQAYLEYSVAVAGCGVALAGAGQFYRIIERGNISSRKLGLQLIPKLTVAFF